VAAGCIGGLDVRIIFVVFAPLAAAVAARAGRVALPTGRRADFDTFFAGARSLFALFFAVRRVVLADRLAVFAECLLMNSI
jgi:hypothetical protein